MYKVSIVFLLYILGCFLIGNGQAHTYLSSITVDGVTKAEGECIRPQPTSKYDYPISALDRQTGLQSGDMTCGWLPSAAKAASKKCPVNPGSKMAVQWHYEKGDSSDTFIVDPSHKGPCIIYMAKSETGAGAVWFKIFEDGYDTATKKFCVDKLKANKGKLEFTIPTDITPGNYLLRGELIALHEGHEMYGAQPYVGCAEITVGGSGTVNPGNLVAFPGAYKANDPGIFFNIYSGNIKSYPIPGPPVYRSGSVTPTPPPTPPTPTPPPSPVTTKRSTTTTTTTTSTTTGRAASAATTATGRAASAVTTATATATSTSTSSGIITPGTPMCYLDGTPNLKGRINRNPPKCGRNDKKARCSVGQCCSKYGYCGPQKERDGKYYEYIDGKMKQVSEEFAINLYCNNATADYRKYPCADIGVDPTNAVGDETLEFADDEKSVTSGVTSLYAHTHTHSFENQRLVILSLMSVVVAIATLF